MIRARTAAALLLAAAAAVAAAGEERQVRNRVRELVEKLATGDPPSRAAAVDELAGFGRAAVPEVGRFAHLLRDDGGRAAAVAALARIGVEDAIALLGAHRQSWSEEAAAEAARLAAGLRALRDPRLGVVCPLAPGVLADAARVPPGADVEIGDTLPEALAWETLAVRRTKSGLEVTVDASGRRETVDSDRPRVLRVGARKRPILVHRRLDAWRAASASLRTGRWRGETVEVWDADLDGVFDGPRDFLRIGDGAFQPVPADALVWGARGVASVALRGPAEAGEAVFTDEPGLPGTSEWAERALEVANAWRRGAGLGPVLVNAPRSEACAKHVDYWRENGFTGHDEAKDKPGFSAEGANAGRRSSVWHTPDASRLVRLISGTVLHRATLLGASREGMGVAIGAGTCLWGGDVDASERGAPVVVPGAGQADVPDVVEEEEPPPDRDPRFYDAPRGYPVTVLWRGAWDDVRDARLDVFVAGAPDALAGDVFSPDAPYTTKGRALETGSITFVAAKPLERKRTYVARFRCERASGPAELSWSFTTR